MAEPFAAFYGDDLTGSIDVLLQASRAGLTGRLLVGAPDERRLHAAADGHDVVGIAGTARSLGPDALAAEVGPRLAQLRDLAPAVVQYKVCSTADSSPTLGSIGRVVELAHEVYGDVAVPVLFAQPDFGRHTAFGHHFAEEDGVVHRLDRQPTMASHPATPMHDSDLVRHLAAQTDLPIGALHLTTYTDAATVAEALRTSQDAATVLDAVTDEHLTLLGEALLALDRRPTFAVGSGGLTTAVARARGVAPGSAGVLPGARLPDGPVLAVSGSRSRRTARQVDAAVDAGWHHHALRLPATDGALADQVLAALADGTSVVVSTGEQRSGAALDRLPARLAEVVRRAATGAATRRVVVCGGDTSSHVVQALGVVALRIVANPVANVVLCELQSDEPAIDGLEVLLKGGQVGPTALLELVRGLGA